MSTKKSFWGRNVLALAGHPSRGGNYRGVRLSETPDAAHLSPQLPHGPFGFRSIHQTGKSLWVYFSGHRDDGS
jgi:hypothetical protein